MRDEFLDRFTNATEQHVLGDSRDQVTTISPLIHPDHLRRVEGFVERSLSAGDTLVFGGERLRRDGLWFEPTLIEPHGNQAEIVQNEVFGPVLTFQTFADEAEAIKLANSTRYGLSAMVFTKDQKKADRFGLGVRAEHHLGELLLGPRPQCALWGRRDQRDRSRGAATTRWTSTVTLRRTK